MTGELLCVRMAQVLVKKPMCFVTTRSKEFEVARGNVYVKDGILRQVQKGAPRS